MQVTVHVCTRRSATHTENQDRAVVGRHVVASAPDVESIHLEIPTVVAVLDGLGGHPAGEVASDVAAHAITRAEPPVDDADAVQLLQDADAAVFAAADRDSGRRGMGTTAAMVSVAGDGRATVVNVGDSSVWRLVGDILDQLSVPDRLHGGILQCLGGHEGSRIEPHVRHLDLEPGDRLLLASDGLTDVLSRRAIAHALRDGADAGAGARELLAAVVSAGPPDDVTIMVVDIDADGNGGD